MKYVMFEVQHKTLTQKVPIIFPNELVHRFVAAVMEVCLEQHFPGAKIVPVSAGDFTLSECSVGGKSTTLGLTYGEGDSQVIRMIDYGGGFS